MEGATTVPDGFREITWAIGEAELQKSVMAVETFEALRAGKTNVVAIRTLICRKRKLIVHPSTGRWTERPSDRFLNEHAWVLAIMNKFGVTPHVNSRTRETSLLPGAEQKLPTVINFFKHNEPFEWKPGSYKKAPGW
jgi:hypothetical protein